MCQLGSRGARLARRRPFDTPRARSLFAARAHHQALADRIRAREIAADARRTRGSVLRHRGRTRRLFELPDPASVLAPSDRARRHLAAAGVGVTALDRSGADLREHRELGRTARRFERLPTAFATGIDARARVVDLTATRDEEERCDQRGAHSSAHARDTALGAPADAREPPPLARPPLTPRPAERREIRAAAASPRGRLDVCAEGCPSRPLDHGAGGPSTFQVRVFGSQVAFMVGRLPSAG